MCLDNYITVTRVVLTYQNRSVYYSPYFDHPRCWGWEVTKQKRHND